MPSRYEEIKLDRINLQSINERESLVGIDQFPEPAKVPRSEADNILDSFPPILAGNELRALIDSLRKAREQDTPRIWTMGAHPVKVGLSRHLIALMEAGFITHLATNGAGIIHDSEMAYFGQTSEDVAATINEGKFSVTRETGEIINSAAKMAKDDELGLGEAMGKSILDAIAPHLDVCLSAACYRLGIPFTVHVAIGTDVTHIHPSFDPSAFGEASHRDFRILAKSISDLHGGVIVNLGSAVILPVVIEKAIALTQNLGYGLEKFDGFNLDFIRHYRPGLNPVKRAIESGGHGAHITGHHELTIPLLCIFLLAE
jgi:hypothetical protein